MDHVSLAGMSTSVLHSTVCRFHDLYFVGAQVQEADAVLAYQHLGCMLQYADFLRSALVKHKYKELMPSLSDLLDPEKFGLEPEVAFLLYRPILARVPFPDTPSQRNPPPEDGEIPEGEEVAMEVEQGKSQLQLTLADTVLSDHEWQAECYLASYWASDNVSVFVMMQRCTCCTCPHVVA